MTFITNYNKKNIFGNNRHRQITSQAIKLHYVGKSISVVNQKVFVTLITIVIGIFALSFLLVINIRSGNQTFQRTNLSAEVDLNSKGLRVISNGSRVTRVYGKVTDYILVNMYVLTTPQKKNLVVFDKFSKPAIGSTIALEGRSIDVRETINQEAGLQILQLGEGYNGTEEFVSASSPVQAL